MSDPSDIGGPGANEERRIASARRRSMPLQLSASERERGAENIFRGQGSAQVLEKAQSDKEIQGKPSRFLGLSLRRAWQDLAEFG
jgi:hypothetical protein